MSLSARRENLGVEKGVQEEKKIKQNCEKTENSLSLIDKAKMILMPARFEQMHFVLCVSVSNQYFCKCSKYALLHTFIGYAIIFPTVTLNVPGHRHLRSNCS